MARWTEEDLQLLNNQLGFMHYNEIARRLGRTERSVREKARRSKLTLFDNIYTAKLLSEELGVSAFTIRKWITKDFIYSRKASWRCKNGLRHERPWIISEESIIEFLKTHGGVLRKVLGEKKVPNIYFRNILEGKIDGHK